MKKILLVLLFTIIGLISVNQVNACEPSYIEYGVRVTIEDCEQYDYLLDILINKNDVSSSLLSSNLNQYYFYYDQEIREKAQNDITSVPYLDYNQDWISARAYTESGFVGNFGSDCSYLAFDYEDYQLDFDEFKVIILDKQGNTIATSGIYSTSIGPDHIVNQDAQMIIYNPTNDSFSLQDYEAIHDVNECGFVPDIGLGIFDGLNIAYIFLLLAYTIGVLLLVIILFAENLTMFRNIDYLESSKKMKYIILGFGLGSLVSFIVFFLILDIPDLAFTLIGLLQVIKVIYIYLNERRLLVLSVVSTVIVLLTSYVLLGALY